VVASAALILLDSAPALAQATTQFWSDFTAEWVKSREWTLYVADRSRNSAEDDFVRTDSALDLRVRRVW
jgi:hypothetical protein